MVHSCPDSFIVANRKIYMVRDQAIMIFKNRLTCACGFAIIMAKSVRNDPCAGTSNLDKCEVLTMQGATIVSGDSPQAAAILDVFTIVLSIAAVIFVIVLGLVIANVVLFRRSKREDRPRQDFGNPKLEIIWTLVPAAILTVVFFVTVRAMHNIQPPTRDHPPNMIVTANQWWWKAEYPGTGAVVANELHMPVDRLWLIRVLSADVDHDFWVPNLGRKVDAIPNHPNHVWMKPRKTGRYLGMCAEFCGAEHAWMRFTVVVERPDKFDTWLKHQAEDAVEPTEPDAVMGKQILMSKTCRNCHAIRGTVADGDVGPDLTHIASRAKIAGGVLNRTSRDLAQWLRNPQKIKPGCYMPNLDLKEEQISYLVAYLESLK
jgi:cytochrome c oxidase subunit 2